MQSSTVADVYLLLCCPISQCVCMGLGNLVAQVFSYIIYLLYSHKNGCDLHQFLVFRIIYECANGNCIFWLEDV